MEITLSTLSDSRLKKLHILKNRSWVSRDDLAKVLDEDNQDSSDSSVDRLVSDLDLKEFGDGKYTTQEIHEAERVSMLSAKARRNEAGHRLNEKTIKKTIAQNSTARDEQISAVRHMGNSGGIAVVEGAAGVGKSYTMSMARQAFEDDGFDVIGVAPQGSAAIELEKSSGIKSKTSFAFYNDYKQGRLNVSSRSIVVFDEAGMADSVSLSRVIDIAHQKGAKVVLVGDRSQLESVSTASLFATIGDELGRAEMTQIARQSDSEKRQISQNFYEGKGEDAVQKMRDLGMIQEEADNQIPSSIAADYVDLIEQGKDTLAVASKNKDVKRINNAIKQELVSRGHLDASTSHDAMVKAANGLDETVRLHENEKIMFRMTDKKLGVTNGDTGTITEFSENGFAVSVSSDGEDSKIINVDLDSYSHIQPAYAVTVHKSQGMTVDKCLSMPALSMADSRALYVAATRAREGTDIYLETGKFQEFKEAAGKTQTKTSTLDHYTSSELAKLEADASGAVGKSSHLLSKPSEPDHHFRDLMASTEYNHLVQLSKQELSEAQNPLSALYAGNVGENHIRNQAAQFGLTGGNREDRLKSLIAGFEKKAHAEVENRPENLDREDLRKHASQKTQEKRSEKASEKGLRSQEYYNGEAILNYHKEAIQERTEAAREYQDRVDAIYRSAGLSSDSTSNSQASYAGKKLRGSASILTQTRRDYMLALQPPEEHGGWFGMHNRMQAFRAQQQERRDRGTIESMLEYKHAKMINDWGAESIRDLHNGSLNTAQQKALWKGIEDRISKDRKALEELINSNDPAQLRKFSSETGVLVDQNGNAKLKSDLSFAERLEMKNEERRAMEDNPDLANVEYHLNPEKFLKEKAEREAKEKQEKEEVTLKSKPGQEKDGKGSDLEDQQADSQIEDGQVAVSSGASDEEKRRSEAEREAQEKVEEEAKEEAEEKDKEEIKEEAEEEQSGDQRDDDDQSGTASSESEEDKRKVEAEREENERLAEEVEDARSMTPDEYEAKQEERRAELEKQGQAIEAQLNGEDPEADQENPEDRKARLEESAKQVEEDLDRIEEEEKSTQETSQEATDIIDKEQKEAEDRAQRQAKELEEMTPKQREEFERKQKADIEENQKLAHEVEEAQGMTREEYLEKQAEKRAEKEAPVSDAEMSKIDSQVEQQNRQEMDKEQAEKYEKELENDKKKKVEEQQEKGYEPEYTEKDQKEDQKLKEEIERAKQEQERAEERRRQREKEEEMERSR